MCLFYKLRHWCPSPSGESQRSPTVGPWPSIPWGTPAVAALQTGQEQHKPTHNSKDYSRTPGGTPSRTKSCHLVSSRRGPGPVQRALQITCALFYLASGIEVMLQGTILASLNSGSQQDVRTGQTTQSLMIWECPIWDLNLFTASRMCTFRRKVVFDISGEGTLFPAGLEETPITATFLCGSSFEPLPLHFGADLFRG